MLNGQDCVFRVDASLAMGSGHVIRCLTLARALAARGAGIRFLCRRHEGDLIDFISREFGVHTLTGTTAVDAGLDKDSVSDHAQWLGTSWQQDAADCGQALGRQACDWLIVDHYALDVRWQHALQAHYRKLLVIDDLADRPHQADILLDQNEYPDRELRYRALLNADCRQLLGPQYTLLRAEFTRLQARDRDGRVSRLLVFFGGADNSNETGKTLEALAMLSSRIETTVVLGSSNRHAEAVRRIASGMPDTTVVQAVDNMAELMQQADLAIAAGGTSTWERAYLGLPAITLSLADNQLAVNQAMHDKGACWHLGDTNTSASDIAAAVSKLQHDPAQVRSMSRAALAIMQNHRGCEGVIETMEILHAAE